MKVTALLREEWNSIGRTGKGALEGHARRTARHGPAVIVRVLRDAHITFRVIGGVAARFYGADRPLADIDIDVPEEDLPGLGERLAPFVVFGPGRFRDQHWDLELLTVAHNGVTIDLGGAHRARIFLAPAQSWVPASADLQSAIPFEALGMPVPVVDRSALVAYKKFLDRDVDRLDVAAIDGESGVAGPSVWPTSRVLKHAARLER